MPGNGHLGRRFGAALGVLACGIAISQVLNGEGSSGAHHAEARPSHHGPPTDSIVPVIEHASNRQVSTFSVFRSLPEGLPPSVTKALRVPLYGLNWALAQRIRSTAQGRFWAVPGRGVICIVGQENPISASANCATTRHAMAHGIAAVLLREPRKRGLGTPRGYRLLVGITPDGTRAMQVYTNHSPITAGVIGGVFTHQDRIMDPPERMVPLTGAPADPSRR